MGFLAALKAPVVAAFTNNVSHLHGGIVTCIYATRGRTPLHLLVNVDERLFKVFRIIVIILLETKILKELLRNY